MLTFSPIKTRRLNVRLRELTIGDAIYLCGMPEHERGVTEAMQRIASFDGGPQGEAITNPRLWTVQERAFVMASYLGRVDPTGPDFEIGRSRLSNYLVDNTDPPADVDIGIAAGSRWRICPLLGVHAESIERLVFQERLPKGREGWYFGAMAAQLLEADQQAFDVTTFSDFAVDQYIEEAAKVLRELSQPAFLELFAAFLDGNSRLNHFFRIGFNEEGVVFTQEVPGTAPARFPCDSIVDPATKQVFGGPVRESDGDQAPLPGDVAGSDGYGDFGLPGVPEEQGDEELEHAPG